MKKQLKTQNILLLIPRAIGRNRQPKHISACAQAMGTLWVTHEINQPVQGQKHDPWLLSSVSQPIKSPGTGKVTFFKEKINTC